MRETLGDFILHQGLGLMIFLLGAGIGSFLDRYINLYVQTRIEEKQIYEQMPVIETRHQKRQSEHSRRVFGKVITGQLLWTVLWNGIAYRILFEAQGFTLTMILYCVTVSAMIVLSAVDLKLFEIPLSMNSLILGCALIHFVWKWSQWRCWFIGFFIISFPLFILFLASGGQAVGGGDIKLMAVCGLLIGWQQIILAFFIGCLLGALYQLIRRKKTGTEKAFAMGPFLSAGVFLTMVL